MKNRIAKVTLGLLVMVFLFNPPVAEAKKKLAARKTVSQGVSGVIVSPRLRADRRALLVNFGNLTLANSVSYTLSYTANGIPQGVAGTITPTENTASRELLFGTCSKNVCTYHRNITGMKFGVASSLKSGKKVIKTFRVKP